MAALETIPTSVANARTERTSPVAAYFARMHRDIHKLWGFGALEDWEKLPAPSPFRNSSLMTNAEIVLNPDGTVYKL
jgi:hypothetical protein